MKISEHFHRPVAAVGPDETIRDAAERMRDERVGCVVVTRNRKVVGILTDRDVALALALGEAAPTDPVGKVMSRNVVTLWDDQGIFNATQYFRDYQVRRLPVVNRDDELVGMITLDDLVALFGRELLNLSGAIEPALEDKVKGEALATTVAYEV